MTTREITNTFGLQPGEWILHCPACSFAHDKNTAARSVCDNCGSRLHLARRARSSETPRSLDEGGRGRVSCHNAEYLAALEAIMAGRNLDDYLKGFVVTPFFEDMGPPIKIEPVPLMKWERPV